MQRPLLVGSLCVGVLACGGSRPEFGVNANNGSSDAPDASVADAAGTDISSTSSTGSSTDVGSTNSSGETAVAPEPTATTSDETDASLLPDTTNENSTDGDSKATDSTETTTTDRDSSASDDSETATEQDATNQEETEPDSTEPDATDQETEPDSTEPDATDQEETEPDSTEPDATNEEETDTTSVESDSTASTSSGTTSSGTTSSGTTSSGTTSSGTTSSGTTSGTTSSGTPECTGNETEVCNECGIRTCNSSTGRFGTCAKDPAATPRCNTGGTGIQSCDSSGFWQTQACNNADTTNCTVSCSESGGSATCEFLARDNDDDGYRSAACAAAPGDDCDDGTALVSPGGNETCDGRDNDCDGYTDILDSTMSIPPVITYFRRSNASWPDNLRRIDVAWHESEFIFVGDGMGESNTNIFAGRGSTNGSVLLFDDATLVSGSDSLYDNARIVSAGGTLAMAARLDGRSYGTVAAVLNSDGSVASNFSFNGEPVGATSGDVTSDGSSFIFATATSGHGFVTPYKFYFGSVSLTGTTLSGPGPVTMPGTIDYINAAHAGTTTAAVFTDLSGSQPSFQMMRYVSGTSQGPTQIASSAQIGDITSLSNGKFAVAWANEDGFRVQVRESNGLTVACDTQDVAFGNGTLDPLDSVAIAESGLGIVVFAADNGTKAGTDYGEAALFVFDLDCEQLTEQGKRITTNVGTSGTELPHAPRLAVGGGHIALAWSVQQSYALDEYASFAQVLPENLCE